jgi:Tol biopolymer transport system component
VVVFSHFAGNGVHLAAVRPDGSRFQQLTAGSGLDQSPSVSPDGKSVVFVRSWNAPDSRPSSLRVIRLDGTHLRSLANDPSYVDLYPAWSPDGTMIAFLQHPVHGGNLRLEIVTPDGSRQRTLKKAPFLLETPITWAPNGDRILVAGDGGFYAGRADGRGYRRLIGFGSDQSRWSPAWSPAGGVIAFLRFHSCGPQCDAPDLYRMRPDGGGIRLVHRNAYEQAWSPDGRTLLYVPALPAEGALHIVAYDLATGHTRDVTSNDFGKQDVDPAWQPRCQLVVTARRAHLVDRIGSHLVCGRGGNESIVSGGHDRIFAGNGNDRINVRNHKFDLVNCGGGVDRVQADRQDHVTANCEHLLR